MNPISSFNRGRMALRCALLLAICWLFAGLVHAQNATSALVGRVQDAKGGGALENARVKIVGTNRQAFTDAFGDYRLAGLAAGTVTLEVFYTGTKPQSVAVTLAAGETVRRDFTLVPAAAVQAGQTSDGVLKLDQFVVDSARDTNAASIAINEQRFAKIGRAHV